MAKSCSANDLEVHQIEAILKMFVIKSFEGLIKIMDLGHDIRKLPFVQHCEQAEFP